MISHEVKNLIEKKSRNPVVQEVISGTRIKEDCVNLEKDINNEIKEVHINDFDNEDVMLIKDTVIRQIKIDKNLVLRVIENSNGRFIDLRRFYKNYPTKKGIRINYAVYKKVNSLLD